MSRQSDFLNELAELLDKHRVAICSRELKKYSEVFFQMYDRRKGRRHKQQNLNTHRLHVSAHDLRGMAKYHYSE